MKLYISPCPNDTFMFDAMINGRIEIEGLDLDVKYFDIEELNSRAIEGEAEFSKISCAIIPQIQASYEISESGAALGRGNGPLLVRKKESLRRTQKDPERPRTPKKTAIPGVHTTANLLIQRLFPEIKERTPMLFSKIADAVERGEVEAGVLIHEGRFLYQERNLELVADLGLLWEEKMSLPLPLGAIAMRRDIDPETKSKFQRVLKRSIEYAFAHPEASRNFIKAHAQELDDTVIDSHISLFVNDFSIELGDEGRAAIAALTAR
ncbi:MAG: 1,4-dihydroxy-6-naphthoate synthase [Rikenellaceae bacterium]